MPSLRCLLGLALSLALSSLAAQEINYATRPGRGLAIYQKNTFASPESAVVFEYSSFKVFPNVTQLRTPQGARYAVNARSGGYLLLLPYPGRGEATSTEALAVLRVAQDRFPKLAAHIRPLRKAWLREEKEVPTATVQAEITSREQNKQRGETFFEWFKNLFSKRPPPALPPSLLESPPPAKTDEPENPSASNNTETEASEKDLEKNLQTIQEYYKKMGKME